MSYSYVGFLPCGCAVAASVEDPRWQRETAKDVAAWLRDGLRVERMPVEQVRAIVGPCVHKAKAAPKAEQIPMEPR